MMYVLKIMLSKKCVWGGGGARPPPPPPGVGGPGLKKRLKERNMEERGYLMDRRRDLEETFEPIVSSNEMAQDIIKNLAPINEKLVEMNRNIDLKREMSRPKIGSKRRLVSADYYGPLAFIRNNMDDVVDKTFGILFKNGNFLIGNKIMKIQDDNIVIGNEVYIGTPDLWTLITENNPEGYGEEDYERYNVLYRDYDPRSSYPRANRLMK